MIVSAVKIYKNNIYKLFVAQIPYFAPGPHMQTPGL